FEKGGGKFARRTEERGPDWSVMRYQPGPQRTIQPVRAAGDAVALAIHLRIVFQRGRAFAAVARQQTLGDADCFLARRAAQQAEPQTNTQATLACARDKGRELLRRLGDAQPARSLRPCELLRSLRMAGHVNCRPGAFGIDKRRG